MYLFIGLDLLITTTVLFLDKSREIVSVCILYSYKYILQYAARLIIVVNFINFIILILYVGYIITLFGHAQSHTN